MASQPPSSGGNSLVDLVCVAVLGLLLWFGAQAIETVTRGASAHASSPQRPAPPPVPH